jgi:phage gp29-like protein
MSRRKLPKPVSFAADTRKNLPGEARGMIANASNDITIPFYSGLLEHADDTLIARGGGKGLKIYDEIERDTHAFAMLQKRKKVLLSREWQVEGASERPRDVEAADLVREVLDSLPFDRICEDLLDATLKGFAVSEIAWTRDGSRIVPSHVKSHDQRRFAFGPDWRPRLLTFATMRMGMELPDRKFIVHRFGVKGENPYGLGLGNRLFWPVFFKRESVTFWLHFLEKYAGPTVVGTTPYGTLTDEQRRFVNTLATIRTSSAVALPIGSDVKFLEAARSGAVTYQDFLAYWDTQISLCTTGETLTSTVGQSGSRALGDVHAEMLELLVDSDSDLLSDTLHQQLLRWIVDYNMPGAAVPHVWRTRPENQKETADTQASQATAVSARDKALREVLATAAKIDDDGIAREIIAASGLLDGLSDGAVDAIVASRFAFGGPSRLSVPVEADSDANGPAFATGLKKKL